MPSPSPVVTGKVLFNDFKRQWADVGAEVLEAVRHTGESGWYILGSEVATFESSLASYWGRRFAIGLASGLDALEIGLRCMGCTPGDKVLMSPVSAFATALAALKIGAVPVFVDSDMRALVDLNRAAEALAKDSTIRFFVPVHLYGQPLDMSELADLRDRFGVRILEDCAQSIGASFNGTATGTSGECAATSFYPTKNLGAFGDGGALLTDSAEIAATARELRDYGQRSKYHHTSIGYNSRLDELHAAILRRVLLPRLNQWTARREQVAARYHAELRNPRITVPAVADGAVSSWHLFPVLAPPDRKQELIAHLGSRGITTAEHYPSALPDQPALQTVRFEESGRCTNAREICAREVSIPIHPYLSDSDVTRVIEACNDWL